MSSESSHASAAETKPFLSSSDEEGSVDLEESKRSTQHILFPRNAWILSLELLASFVLALLLAFVVARQWIPPTHSPEGLLRSSRHRLSFPWRDFVLTVAQQYPWERTPKYGTTTSHSRKHQPPSPRRPGTPSSQSEEASFTTKPSHRSCRISQSFTNCIA